MTKKKDSKKYVWYHDNSMVGVIILILASMMQIFAFLDVPILSSIHGYTVGMLFGFFNPLFYIYVIYYALVLIFGNKVKLPKWVKLNNFEYWFLVISTIFISTSTFHYQSTTGFASIGAKPWSSFEKWYFDFTSHSAWAPAQTNGGLIGVFLYSLSASIISGIGSLISSISLIAVSISLIFTGSFIGLYTNLKNRRMLEQKTKDNADDKDMNFDSFITPDKTSKSNNTKPDKTENELPFEDPFQ